MGKFLISSNIFIAAGLLITYLPKSRFWQTARDITIERENFKFYFPLATSIIISIILSLIVFLYNKFKN